MQALKLPHFQNQQVKTTNHIYGTGSTKTKHMHKTKYFFHIFKTNQQSSIREKKKKYVKIFKAFDQVKYSHSFLYEMFINYNKTYIHKYYFALIFYLKNTIYYYSINFSYCLVQNVYMHSALWYVYLSLT